MAEIGDVQNFERTYSSQLDKLDSADIDERDRTEVRRLVKRRNVDGIQKSTNVGTLNRLRLAAERTDCPLVEFEADDYYALMDTLEVDHGLADGTLRNYRKALKRFAEFEDFAWAEEVTIGKIATHDATVEPSKLLTDEEVEAMLDAANGPRDKAIMAMLRDTGMRVGALCNLRVRDVAFTDAAGEFTVRDLPGNKEAEGTRPFTWARGPLVNWLDVHPQREDDDAPLFIKFKKGRRDATGEALSTSAVRRMLTLTAKRADVDPDRVNPHNWRDTTFAEWKLDDLSDRKIKHRGFHVENSNMLRRYGPIEDKELNREILAEYGLAEEGVARSPTLEQCPQCGTSLRDGARYCAGCGLALDDDLRETVDAAEQAVERDMIELEDADDRRLAHAVKAAIREDPSLVADALGGGDAHEESPASPSNSD